MSFTTNIYLYLNGNSKTPSTRLRWLNFIPDFEAAGMNVKVLECASSSKERLQQIRAIELDSTVLVQKKFLSLFELILLRRRARRLYLDVDDAIWRTHPHKGNPYVNSLKRIYKRVFYLSGFCLYHKIICANETLAKALRGVNRNIEIVPTSPSDPEAAGVIKDDLTFRIVWTGTRANFFYLDEIKSQLKNFLLNRQDSELCIISDGEYKIEGLNNDKQLRNIVWSAQNESTWIQKSSLGIMPLTLDEWSKGKSAFKLIKYMKLGLPVMATDFGFQQKMIQSGENGILVNNNDWEKTLRGIVDDSPYLMSLADRGSECYLRDYAPSIIREKYLSILKD